MAELVAGAFLQSSLQVAFERLASREVLDFFLRRKLNDGLLKKLRIILISVNKVIEDAEERQYGDRYVKQWLDELKDEVFKAEDLLDEIATEALRQKLEAESQTATSKVRGFFNACVNRNLPNKRIESRIKQVLDNLEYLIKQNEILGLREGSTVAGIQQGMNRKVFKRLPTTSLIDESKTYGRDADKEKIIEILLSRDMGENQNKSVNKLPVNVIAIVGMGGVGKTTLARLVYEDKRMKDQFQHSAWVCISEEFDVVQATNAILEALDCEPKIPETPLDSGAKKPETPHSQTKKPNEKLKEKLMGKIFFLVLDDVWNENRQIWEVFHAPFKHVAPGSKILVTTRNKKVAEVMYCTDTYDLKPLHDDDCWKLFAGHAFNDQQHVDPKLEEIGREIVKKCGGLPLAIKTMGSLLYTKQSYQDWEKILKSSIWHLSEDDSNIIPSLRLSYHYLSSNLKRCFAYCSIFPKDYVIDKNVLIQLWTAEGLLHSVRIGESLEEVGNEIFNDLESRSFFEPSKRGGNYFIMHDLLNDLAKSVMGEFCLRLEYDWTQEISTKARYLTHLGNDYQKVHNFEDIFKCHQLHSFLELQQKDSSIFVKKGNMLSRLIHLKYMRALSLNGHVSVKRLKNDVNNLLHLRYLDLSNTAIKKLPDSMCSMINLQTLKLKNCPRLTKLPSKFHKLINLHHLDLEKSGIKKMPKYMSKLEKLQTMSQFVVRKNKESELKELGALKHLKGKLILLNLNNVIDPKNAREANLREKHLVELVLDWNKYMERREVSQEMEEQILEALEPNCEVKELQIICYGGIRFPNWFGSSQLSNLVSLNLDDCTSCVNLPPLGQLPSLEKLEISGLGGIKVIDEEFYGNGSSNVPFRSLAFLKFQMMSEWEEWNVCYEGDSFPCLEELWIWSCPRLTKSLPQHLPSLKKLNIDGCSNLKTALPKASALEALYLMGCKKILVEDLPRWSSTDGLPPFRDLSLFNCTEMESLPQGGLLSNLHRLMICTCPKVIASRKDWGLHEILSLKELVISDKFENVESFPEEGLLPPNLNSLEFRDCHKLRRINHRGLLHLHSLSSLSFEECPSLSFEGMPDNGLPTSLTHLYIGWDCKLLEERCRKETGQDWPKISHIPQVIIFWEYLLQRQRLLRL